MILKTDNLTIGYCFGKSCKEILQNLNTEISEGKIILLLGSNGSGKSTFLKTISGLLKPLSGKIFIRGETVSDFSTGEWSKHVSIVLTERTDTGNLDVYSLVALGRVPYTGRTGKLHSDDHFVVENALELTGLKSFAERIVMELSDGERQRVMIARAIAQDTPLVILDEPTAFLDAVYKKKLMEWLRNLAAATGKSFIISTHDLHLAKKFGDELWMIAGKKLQICSPEKYTEEELVNRIENNISYE